MIRIHTPTAWVFFVGGALLWACSPKPVDRAQTAAQKSAVSVQVETVQPRSVPKRLRWTGVTAPRAEIPLTFKGSGRIKKLFFEEGAFVRKGQRLGQLVEEDYWSYAQLARVQVRTLEPDARRLENLAAADAVPKAEADRMRGQVNVARAQLRQAEAALAGVFLDAPMDGVIEKKSVGEGDLVSPAREVARLVDLSKIRVQISVSEEELAHLQAGTAVDLQFFNPPWQTRGAVERISPMADFRTRTFPVSVLMENPMENGAWKLRAGMRVAVSLTLPEPERIYVPFSAVLQTEEGQKGVFLVRDGAAQFVPVVLGRLQDGLLEILEGLQPGDVVVKSGQHYLRNNTPVHILQ